MHAKHNEKTGALVTRPSLDRRVNAAVVHARRERSIVPVTSRVGNRHLRLIHNATIVVQQPGAVGTLLKVHCLLANDFD